MPLLEVLPNSHASAPGWAYVPDLGLDPVKAGHAPANPRKRRAVGRVAPHAAADRTARQQAALARRLAELDRDSARDVAIAVPKREGEKGGGGGRGGLSSSRRRMAPG